MYLALYRKYRPRTFEEVIGQEHIIKTLVNQIKYDKISHAYLFTGSRGTGKTSTAKIFAKAINCTDSKNGSPCLSCETCKALDGTNIDVLEIDAASNNGVDEIRDLREKIKYPPVVGKYKVYIIDEVHMLSTSAFNALLKTLEEPPKHTIFILATTEVHKLPATILSRCLRFDFRLVPLEILTAHLKKVLDDEGVKYDDQAINVIVRAGEGSVRDMLSIADRCVSFSGEELTYEKVLTVLGVSEREVLISMADKILSKDTGAALVELDKVLSLGKTPLVFSNDLIGYFRDLLLVNSLGDKSRDIVVVRDDVYQQMKKQVEGDNYAEILKAIEVLSSVEQELRYSAEPRIVLETAIIKTINEASLVRRVEALEEIVKKFPR
ncbi:MAG: DNA polymerase III subunit gamma/tau [Clostridiales bacterium]|nr:DNA polymerase III subunit gamma/tau [Clostridiales bacterium]